MSEINPEIYFGCSIAGGRENAEVYPRIVEIIQESGGVVLSLIFADPKLNAEDGTDGLDNPQAVYNRDVEWLMRSDGVILDITEPSHGVGREIEKAQVAEKPLFCIFNESSGRRMSSMLTGDDNLLIVQYVEPEDLKEPINEFIAGL